MSTIKELLDYGKEILENSGNEYAKYERKVLLEHVTGYNYMYMLMNADEELSPDKTDEYKRLLEKRALHYPLQYILGYTHFMDYTFLVNENVLIPRSDTEILVESVNDLFAKNILTEDDCKILDLCCGSGCIGISLKLYHNKTDLTLSDISDKAIEVARSNLHKYSINANCNIGDLWEGIDGTFDLIVCNPPYIKSSIIPTLMPEVKEYEPVLALDGGEDGIIYYKRVIDKAKEYLNKKGFLFFEIGYDQGDSVSGLMKKAGFQNVAVIKDYAQLDRGVCGHL